MSWDLETTTRQKARKQYNCEASDWILNSELTEEDFAKNDWKAIEKAKSEKFKILEGVEYTKTCGLFIGEWTTFRARLDMHDICVQYDLYGEA